MYLSSFFLPTHTYFLSSLRGLVLAYLCCFFSSRLTGLVDGVFSSFHFLLFPLPTLHTSQILSKVISDVVVPRGRCFAFFFVLTGLNNGFASKRPISFCLLASDSGDQSYPRHAIPCCWTLCPSLIQSQHVSNSTHYASCLDQGSGLPWLFPFKSFLSTFFFLVLVSELKIQV